MFDGGDFFTSTYISTNVNITSHIFVSLIKAAIVDQVARTVRYTFCYVLLDKIIIIKP